MRRKRGCRVYAIEPGHIGGRERTRLTDGLGEGAKEGSISS
jgi:hypothetical protein